MLDRAAARHPLEATVEAAVRAGVDWVQLRERGLEGEDWLAWADAMSAAVRRADANAKLIVNRRLDIAMTIGADGVHLGFDALATKDARALLGPGALIGVSAHADDELPGALAAGASYAHLAPVFDPRSKPASRPALGPAALRAAAAHGLPVLAQGGIDVARCHDVLAAGAAGVAVTGAVLMAHDPARAASELREALDAAR